MKHFNARENRPDDVEQTKKRRRAHARGRFHRIKRRFVESFPDEQCCVLRDLSRDLEKAYDDYKEMLDEQIYNDTLLELQKDMDSIYKELNDVKSLQKNY